MKYILYIILTVAFLNSSLNATLFDPRQTSKKYIETMQKFDIDVKFLQDRILMSKLNKLSTSSKKRSFLKNLDKAYLFISLLRKKIKAAGIPEEFLYLAMAESNFSPRAYSNKRAAGLWQFMPYTGRKYGLRIDDYVDERKDVLKSTDAAIRYLKDLHKRFGKWYLAAMAYNCGEGRVNQAIRRAGSDDLKKLLQTSRKRRKQYLPRETRNYIRKILSFALIVKEANFFTENKNSHLLNRGMSMPIITRNVPANVHLSDISDVLNMKYNDLKKINRHLRYNITPPDVKNYKIYIPYSRLAFFNSNQDKIKPSSSGFRVHVVKRGDTLYSLSRAFGASVNMIKLANNMTNNNIRVNKKIVIPVAGKYIGNRKRRVKSTYKVRRGDTLGKISSRFKIKVKDIIRQNDLTSERIKIGEKLVIYN